MHSNAKPVVRSFWIAPILTALLPFVGNAQSTEYIYDINTVGESVAIEQDTPDFPGHRVRRGQEGWVRMSYVVTPDGRAIDPIILDSSGGGGFEVAAREVTEKWRFESNVAENAWNYIDIRSEIEKGRDRATSNFMRRSSGIVTDLRSEKHDDARTQADATFKRGGWNLYESTMLWLMMGRVEGVEGNQAGKLEAYSRALAMGNAAAIPQDDRVELLEKIFLLQTHFNQLAAANRTFSRIESMGDYGETLERNSDRIQDIRRKLAGSGDLLAQAKIYNPCNCDDGEPIWHYVPARRTFSFANANGNVERFEARCEAGRLQDSIEEGKSWTLAAELGTCRVMVFGDDEATFDFVEHGVDSEDSAGQTAVASNDVLDQRDRSQ